MSAIDRDILAEARDLGYEGNDLCEAVLILCMDGYEDRREVLCTGAVICALDRWVICLVEDESDTDAPGALISECADAGAALIVFDAAIRKEVVC